MLKGVYNYDSTSVRFRFHFDSPLIRPLPPDGHSTTYISKVHLPVRMWWCAAA